MEKIKAYAATILLVVTISARAGLWVSIATMMTGVCMAGNLSVTRIFSDGAVLQRGLAVPVWGTAAPGAEVTVSFGKQEKGVSADGDGMWKLHLDPLEASAEGTLLRVESNASVIEIKDVLVGEVWLCGGQSNMAWTIRGLRGKKNATHPVNILVQKEIAEANDPALRMFGVDVVQSPLEEARTLKSKTGWIGVNPKDIIQFSAVGYFFGKELRRELDVPVGLIYCSRGGTKVEAWTPLEGFEKVTDGMTYYEEERKTKKARMLPTSLFNGMVAPLAPFAMRGVIWYQGESNCGYRTERYRETFHAMIDTWRARWNQDRLDFYWCQLANFESPKETPADHVKWAEIRNQQREVLDLVPHAGMAVLHDIGEKTNVHPKNKIDAAKRLSLWALAKTYPAAAAEDLVYSGPLYKAAEVDGKKLRVRFAHAGSGLMAGSKHDLDPVVEVDVPLGGFEVCAADKAWKPAVAKIVAADTIEVSSDEVSSPVGVRYAWAADPAGANLYNREGLPASVFVWAAEGMD